MRKGARKQSMKKMKRLAAVLIVASMLFSGASCSQGGKPADGSPDSSGADTSTDAANTEEETEYRYYEHLPAKDLGGMEFRIISRITDKGHDAQQYTDYGNDEIDAEELDGSQINDTVYKRNRELEERYNFSFNSIQLDKNPMATVRQSVLAGSDDFDAVVDGIGAMCDYSMYYPLDDVGGLDLFASCWDQNVNSSLSIGKKHYIAVGDMLTLDKKGTWCMLFNKKLAANYQLGCLYDLVRAGSWTMDAFYSMARQGSSDINGDGVQDESDAWGFLTEHYNINILMFGGKARFAIKDENDYPVLDIYNDRTVAVFEKAFKIMSDRDLCLNMGWSKNGPADCLKAFAEDRGLFYMTGIGTAMEYRYMDSDFGIIPIPKYDEAQDNYYTTLSKFNSAAIGIPKTSTAPDDVGFILQATCMASTHTLKSTFYNIVLHGIIIRDEESRDMLDIIFANRVFDIIFINNWGGIGDIFTTLLTSNSDKLSSMYKTREKSALTAISKAIEKYQQLA